MEPAEEPRDPDRAAPGAEEEARPGEELPIRYRLRLKPGRERSLELRHPWVFSGAVAEVEEIAGAVAGDLGDVVAHEGRFLARGTIQPESQILCRVLRFDPGPIDADFLAARLEAAAAARETWIDREETTAWRLVNSEADGLPGLIVDRYGSHLVTQTLTSGMRRLRPLWLPALLRLCSPTCVLERGERGRREPTGEAGPPPVALHGDVPAAPVEIREHGLRFRVDLAGGQKTGFYLDQRENRQAVRRHARGREVLNLFGYSGAFSVYAGAGGARRVVQVETSAPARELTRANWDGNGLAPSALEIVGEDVFRFLRHDRRSYDLIVLDPPPFARDRGSLERATRAYKDLHLRTFCRARPGALIWTFSCSQQVTPDLFQKVVFGAALDVRAEVQILGRPGPGCDHPVHLDHPQGEYLKGLWLRVVRPGALPGSGSDA